MKCRPDCSEEDRLGYIDVPAIIMARYTLGNYRNYS